MLLQDWVIEMLLMFKSCLILQDRVFEELLMFSKSYDIARLINWNVIDV